MFNEEDVKIIGKELILLSKLATDNEYPYFKKKFSSEKYFAVATFTLVSVSAPR